MCSRRVPELPCAGCYIFGMPSTVLFLFPGYATAFLLSPNMQITSTESIYLFKHTNQGGRRSSRHRHLKDEAQLFSKRGGPSSKTEEPNGRTCPATPRFGNACYAYRCWETIQENHVCVTTGLKGQGVKLHAMESRSKKFARGRSVHWLCCRSQNTWLTHSKTKMYMGEAQ